MRATCALVAGVFLVACSETGVQPDAGTNNGDASAIEDSGPKSDTGVIADGAAPDAGVEDTGPAPDTGPPHDSGLPSFQPLRVGATWTYRKRDLSSGAQGDLVTRVDAFEDIGDLRAGTIAFRVFKEKLGGGTSISWDRDLGDRVVRVRDQNRDLNDLVTADEYYDPHRVRVEDTPAHTALNATWIETYTQTDVDPVTGNRVAVHRATWTVEAVDEMVTVPAGTFPCIRLRRDAGTAPKTFWFSRGVGKIREEGGQIEELVSFNLP